MMASVAVVVLALVCDAAPVAAGQAGPKCANVTSSLAAPGYSSVACTPAKAAANGRLLLWFGGSCSQPQDYMNLMGYASSTGFHAISIRYENCPTVAAACEQAAVAGAAAGASCFGKLREVRLNGGKYVMGNLSTAVTDAQAALPQFEHLLGQLGWQEFVSRDGPDWSMVVVGGSSQGAGMALMVSQVRSVAASLQFAGVDDVVPSPEANSSVLVAAPWIVVGNRAPKTPLERVFGFSNVRGFCCEYWNVNWRALHMHGAFANVDGALAKGGAVPASHKLCSARSEGTALQEHCSVARDLYFKPVWAYLLSQGTVGVTASNITTADHHYTGGNAGDGCGCLPPKAPPDYPTAPSAPQAPSDAAASYEQQQQQQQRQQQGSVVARECSFNGYLRSRSSSNADSEEKRRAPPLLLGEGNATCVCSPGWQGPACETLRLPTLSADFATSGTYGRDPNVTSWGATLVQEPSDESYHLFVTEEQNGCGMMSWKQNSAIVHAVSATPGTGAFRRVGMAVPFATNPSVHWDAKAKMWRMLVLKTGGPASKEHHCGGPHGDGLGEVDDQLPIVTTSEPAQGHNSTEAGARAGNGTNQLYSTPSLSQNWTLTAASFPGCNNPTGAVDGAGTAWLLCHNGPGFHLFSAQAGWTAPVEGWVKHGNILRVGDGVREGACEDPSMWIDKKSGTFHVLAHCYSTTAWNGTSEGEYCAAHLFSDAPTNHSSWGFSGGSTSAPYSFGGVLSSRERPTLTLDSATGAPAFLTNGVSALGYNRQAKHRDWAFTLIQAVTTTPSATTATATATAATESNSEAQ